MHECCCFNRSPEILVDLQFVFENLQKFLCKQMQLAFVLWFKKRKRCKKAKSSMARSLPVENLLPQNVGSIINYLQ